MMAKMNGLYPDLIIHPGETLSDILIDRDISQKELAVRTNHTEKHISKVVNGKANITPSFAHKLELALGIDFKFWMNSQTNYDKELIEFKELVKISEAEFNILKELKAITNYFIEQQYINAKLSKEMLIMRLRELLRVSNLTTIPKLTITGAFRRASCKMNCPNKQKEVPLRDKTS